MHHAGNGSTKEGVTLMVAELCDTPIVQVAGHG